MQQIKCIKLLEIQILVPHYLTIVPKDIAWVNFMQEHEIITFKVKFF